MCVTKYMPITFTEALYYFHENIMTMSKMKDQIHFLKLQPVITLLKSMIEKLLDNNVITNSCSNSSFRILCSYI